MYSRDYSFNPVRNEIAIQNLIMVASNERLFNNLDRKTQNALRQVINLYTKGCLENIIKLPASEDKGFINEDIVKTSL